MAQIDTPAAAPLALKWRRVKAGYYTAEAPHGYDYVVLRNDVDGGWDIIGGSSMTYRGFRNNLPTFSEAKVFALTYAQADQHERDYQIEQTARRDRERMIELAQAGDVPAQRIVGMTPDSISADAVASTEGETSDDVRLDDQPTCAECGNDVDDWGQSCGYCMGTDPDVADYRIQLAKDMAPATVRPCPGLPIPAPVSRPVLSSFAGLASFRVGIVL